MITCLYCKSQFIQNKRSKTKKYCSKRCRERNWVNENRDKFNENVRNYRKRRYKAVGHWQDEGPKARDLKAWMVSLKSRPCSDCKGTFEICCMDFDHRDGEIKCYNVGSMFAHHYSKTLIESELLKCDLVCANCHRIRTRNRRRGNGTSRF